MLAPKEQKRIKTIETDIGRFEFYEDLVIGEVTEGVHISNENAAKMVDYGLSLYGNNKPFVYISNRVNSYSIDPLWYYEAGKVFPNCKGFAIVTGNSLRRIMFNLEKLFIKTPIGVFSDLESALEWSEKLLSAKRR